MKKIMLIAFVVVAIFCSRQNVNAQITLEHTYDNASYHLYMVNLELEGDKYVWRDLWLHREVRLYNLDHSLFKAMALPSDVLWYGSSIPGLLYISEHLFNLNDKIEYLFTYQDVTTYQWKTKIIDEDGIIIFEVDTLAPLVSPNSPQQQLPIYNTSSGVKMILSNAISGGRIANVYGLPGTLTNSIEPIGLSSDDLEQLSIHPNPNDGNATIEFKLPKGINSGEIVLYNMDGSEVKRYKVDGMFHNLVLNNSLLSSGTYLYQLIAGSKAVDVKKMIIIH